MWIWTSGGFVSAVQHKEDPSKVMVRARDEQSLKTMAEGIEVVGNAFSDDETIDREIRIWSMEMSDYRWRAVLSKETFALWLQHEVLSYLTYTNFKTALTEVRGEGWHRAAMSVWSTMQRVGDGPQAWGSVGAGGVAIPYTPKNDWGFGYPKGSETGSTFYEGFDNVPEANWMDEDWHYTEEMAEPPEAETLPDLDEFATDAEWEAYLAAHPEEAAAKVAEVAAAAEDHYEVQMAEAAALPATPAKAARAARRRRGKGRK